MSGNTSPQLEDTILETDLDNANKRIATLEDTNRDLTQLWDLLHQEFPNANNSPSGFLTAIRAAFQRAADQGASSSSAQATTSCTHVAELQGILEMQDPWDKLLNQVEDLHHHECPSGLTARLPGVRAADLPEFSGESSDLVPWTSRIELLLRAYLPDFEQLGEQGLTALTSLVLSRLTGDAAQWVSSDTYDIDPRASGETNLRALLNTIRKAFCDPAAISAALTDLRNFRGEGLTFVKFHIQFETLCRQADVSYRQETANSAAATILRGCLSYANLKNLQENVPAPLERPEELSMEQMWPILSRYWQTPRAPRETTTKAAEPKENIRARAATSAPSSSGVTQELLEEAQNRARRTPQELAELASKRTGPNPFTGVEIQLPTISPLPYHHSSTHADLKRIAEWGTGPKYRSPAQIARDVALIEKYGYGNIDPSAPPYSEPTRSKKADSEVSTEALGALSYLVVPAPP